MTDDRARTDDAARMVFGGLVPRALDPARGWTRGRRSTMPIVLAGTVAAATLTGPILQALPRDATPDQAPAPDRDDDLAGTPAAPAVVLVSSTRPAAQATSAASFATAAVPATYRVVTGDTISGIAARFGLSTTTVLSINGLSWKSIIFPGQLLKLGGTGTQATSASAPVAIPAAQAGAAAASGSYTVQRGDTISRIAAAHRVAVQAVLDANRLSWTSIIYPGQVLRMPGGASPIQLVSSVTPVASKPATAPAPATQAPPASSMGKTTYTIRSGDTLSAIATRTGVTLQALLSANGLTLGSVIYAGRTLTIPGSAATVTTPAGTVTGIITGGVTPLTKEMRQNAAVIVQVGRSLGVPEYGLVVALSAAMQESSLRNLSYGDRDSVGLFQQRPSAGWGSNDQLMDPAYAAKLFFGGPKNPNAPRTRGLLDVPGWQSMTVTRAAQAVQISAYPDAYAKWETSARSWLTQL